MIGEEVHICAIALLQVAGEQGIIEGHQAKAAIACLSSSADKIQILTERINRQMNLIKELKITRLEMTSLTHSLKFSANILEDYVKIEQEIEGRDALCNEPQVS